MVQLRRAALRGSFEAAAGEGGPALSPRAILSAIREGLLWLIGHPVFGPLAGVSALLGIVDSGLFGLRPLRPRRAWSREPRLRRAPG
jgi:hypothetical protein